MLRARFEHQVYRAWELNVPGCSTTEPCLADRELKSRRWGARRIMLHTPLSRGSLFVIRMQYLYLTKPPEQWEYERLRFTKLFTWTPLRLTKIPTIATLGGSRKTHNCTLGGLRKTHNCTPGGLRKTHNCTPGGLRKPSVAPLSC